MNPKPLLYHFNNSPTAKLPTLSEVGGKALSLMKTFQAGFPVPTGFVLTSAFFEKWTKSKQTRSEAQEQLLKEAMKQMKEEGIQLFSVRSSSPEEDLEGTSFAGMYETSLNVQLRSVKKAIVKSYLSCFDERVAEYKKKQGFGKEAVMKPKIAVVVQEQIASETAGVGFSLNPLNNCYDEAVIDANFGLGENVVSGTKTPDSYIVDKVQGNILEQKLGEKRKKAVLSERELLEVGALIGKVEAFYGMPIDIEWAFAEGKLYLLQARPITAYFKVPEIMQTKPGEKKNAYVDVLIIKQGLVEPMSTLGMDALNFVSTLVGAQGMIDGSNVEFGYAYGGKMYTNMASFMKFL